PEKAPAPAKAQEKKSAAAAPPASGEKPGTKPKKIVQEQDADDAADQSVASRPAPMSRRILACICDLCCLLCLWGLLLPVAGLAWRLLYGPASADGTLAEQFLMLFTNAPIQIALGWAAAALLSFLLFFLIVPLFSGRTLGQRTAGIEVMRRKDEPAGAGAMFLRFIGYAISYASVVILFLAPLILPRRASLADILSGTRQQEERHYLSGEAMMAFLPIFGAVLAIGLGIPLAALAVGILG
ncbi:MAG: RDD family protein, partial [Thermodesulfobacteriota bacterium]